MSNFDTAFNLFFLKLKKQLEPHLSSKEKSKIASVGIKIVENMDYTNLLKLNRTEKCIEVSNGFLLKNELTLMALTVQNYQKFDRRNIHWLYNKVYEPFKIYRYKLMEFCGLDSSSVEVFDFILKTKEYFQFSLSVKSFMLLHELAHLFTANEFNADVWALEKLQAIGNVFGNSKYLTQDNIINSIRHSFSILLFREDFISYEQSTALNLQRRKSLEMHLKKIFCTDNTDSKFCLGIDSILKVIENEQNLIDEISLAVSDFDSVMHCNREAFFEVRNKFLERRISGLTINNNEFVLSFEISKIGGLLDVKDFSLFRLSLWASSLMRDNKVRSKDIEFAICIFELISHIDETSFLGKLEYLDDRERFMISREIASVIAGLYYQYIKRNFQMCRYYIEIATSASRLLTLNFYNEKKKKLDIILLRD